MSILRFDDAQLLAELERLTNRARVAFAAACAERQFLAYVRYSEASKHGDASQLARALSSLWEDLEAPTTNHGMLEAQLHVCMSLLPDDDSGALVERVYAENAVATVAFAIRARLTNACQEVVWAARRSYESADHYVASRLNPKIIERDAEERIISDPVVQAELNRQQADLRQLANATNSASEKDALADVRRRSRTEQFCDPRTS